MTPEEERESWQYRAVAATRGNTSQLGALVIAILKRPGRQAPPAFGPSAVITPDGFVMSNFVDKHGMVAVGVVVGSVDEVVGNFRGLADHLKLNDAERQEMFDLMRDWISTDYRAADSPLF